MTINLRDELQGIEVEISIDEKNVTFEWQDENEVFQAISLNIESLKKAMIFLEDDKKRPKQVVFYCFLTIAKGNLNWGCGVKRYPKLISGNSVEEMQKRDMHL